MAQKPQEVAKPPTSSLSAPDFMKGSGGKGTQQLDPSTVETPRLALLQAVSPQVTEYEEARPGTFWHSATNQTIGDKAGFDGIILHIDQRAILWRPRPPYDVGGMLARADDLRGAWSPSNTIFEVKIRTGKTVKWNTGRSVEQSGLLVWGSEDPSDPTAKTAGTEMYNFVVAFPAYPEVPPAVFTFQNASLKVGRKVAGSLVTDPIASFGYIHRFSTELVEGGGGKFYMPVLRRAGYVRDQDAYHRYEAMSDRLNELGLKMREEGIEAIEASVSRETENGPAY